MGNILRYIFKECEEPETSKIDIIKISPTRSIPDNAFMGSIEDYIYYSNNQEMIR